MGLPIEHPIYKSIVLNKHHLESMKKLGPSWTNSMDPISIQPSYKIK